MRACARRPAVFPVNEWTSGSEPGHSDGAWGQSEQDCDHDSVQVELQSWWERSFCGKVGCAGRSQVEAKTFVHLAIESLYAMEDP